MNWIDSLDWHLIAWFAVSTIIVLLAIWAGISESRRMSEEYSYEPVAKIQGGDHD